MTKYQPRLPGLLMDTENFRPSAKDELQNWPNISSETVCRHASLFGAAGEAFFDYQMLLFGEVSMNVTESLPYDRLLMRHPFSLRVQVKSLVIPRENGYRIIPKCGCRRSSLGMRAYHEDDYNLLAVVLVQENVAFYTAEKAPRIMIPFADIEPLRQRPRATFDAALQSLQMQAEDRPETVGFPLQF